MPSFATLTDDFDDGTLDSGLWPLSSGGGLTRETGGRGGVLCDTGFNRISTDFEWSMPAGAGVFARVWPDALGGATTECFTALRFESDAQPGGTDLGIRVDRFNGNIVFESRTGHFDGSAVTITYSATDHAWWRILRSDSTTLLMQTAPDAGGAPGTWTTRRTLAVPAWMSTADDIAMFVEVHRNSGTAGWSEIDSVNTAATGTAEPTAATGTAAASDASIAVQQGGGSGGAAAAAYDATVSTVPAVSASAGVAIATAVAYGATVPITSAPAGTATATATAHDAIVSLGDTFAEVSTASATAAAYNATIATGSTVTLPPGLVPVRSLTTAEILTGNRITRLRYDLLTESESPKGTLTGVADGYVDWSASTSIHGGGGLTVVDHGQAVDWLTDRIRPVMLIEGLPEQPLGVYLVSEGPEDWGDTGRAWGIKMLDKTSIPAQDAVEGTYVLDAGAVVTDEIVTLIESTGETNHAITPSTATLTGPLVWEAGTSKLRIINDLLATINYFSLYCDHNGQYRGEPYVRPAARPILWEFLDGAESIYSPDFVRDVDLYGIPNKVVIVGQGDGDTPALVSEPAINDDPLSPYSTVSRGRTIVHTETGVEITDQSTLDDYARRRLIELTSPTSSIDVMHAYLPGLTFNDAVRLRRVPAGIDARHVITRMEIALDPTALVTSTLRQVVDL